MYQTAKGAAMLVLGWRRAPGAARASQAGGWSPHPPPPASKQGTPLIGAPGPPTKKSKNRMAHAQCASPSKITAVQPKTSPQTGGKPGMRLNNLDRSAWGVGRTGPRADGRCAIAVPTGRGRPARPTCAVRIYEHQIPHTGTLVVYCTCTRTRILYIPVLVHRQVKGTCTAFGTDEPT